MEYNVSNKELTVDKITTNNRIFSNEFIKLKTYTVATLPVGQLGDTALVTDATSPTYLGTLTGGGAVKTPVFFDGSVWRSY